MVRSLLHLSALVLRKFPICVDSLLVYFTLLVSFTLPICHISYSLPHIPSHSPPSLYLTSLYPRLPRLLAALFSTPLCCLSTFPKTPWVIVEPQISILDACHSSIAPADSLGLSIFLFASFQPFFFGTVARFLSAYHGLYRHLPSTILIMSGSIHRYSMPSAGLGSQIHPNTSNFSNNPGLESFNAAKFLFNDDDRATLKEEDRIPTPDIKSYLKLTDPDDKFPTLSRRDDSGLVRLLFAHVLELFLLTVHSVVRKFRRVGSCKLQDSEPGELEPQSASHFSPKHATEHAQHVSTRSDWGFNSRLQRQHPKFGQACCPTLYGSQPSL